METDIAIIGGGIIGSSIAYHLALSGAAGHITVIEPEPSYINSSTARSASAVRTQFNLGINVAMSAYGWEFYKNASSHLDIGDGNKVDIGLESLPYLVLSGAAGAERMRAAHLTQRRSGADVNLLITPTDFASVPWLKADGVAAATIGRSGEGWLDPVLTLQAVRRKAEHLGVLYVEKRVVKLHSSSELISRIILDDGQYISAKTVVNAAGTRAAEVAAMAGVVLPIEARKRTGFVFTTPNPPLNFTNLVDPTFAQRGIYVRPYQGKFMALTSPAPEIDHHCQNSDQSPDVRLFEDIIKPGLARRVVGFEDIELVSSWAGHYEVCTFDWNAIIGRQPEITNLIMACGLSGHGIMHAPAVGRGVAELLTKGDYTTLDLMPFRFERIAEGAPLDDIQTSEYRSTDAGI